MSEVVDEIDWRILVELTRDPFATYNRLAQVIDATSTTAKRRLDQMGDRGTYHGVRLRPSAEAFGRHDKIWPFALGGQAFPDPEDVLAIDPVIWCSRVYDGILIVGVHADSPDDPVPEALTDLLGTQPVFPVTPGSRQAPEGTYPLSSIDWRVLKVLVATPRATITDLADRSGLSARSVRARRDTLLENGVIETSLALDVSHEPGDIAYSLYVNFEDEAAQRAFQFDGAARVHQHRDPPGLVLLGLASTYPEANEVEKTASAQPGVQDARLVISQGTYYATEKLTDAIQDEIDRWEQAKFSRKKR